jgi:16S rRNA (cytosine967-C5)-methyltransferase
MSDIPSKRIATHSSTCAAVVAEVLVASLLERQPADRCLGAIFRQRRQLGARDRRVIGETLFAVLRWWGWLRHLAPAEFTAAMAAGRPLQRPLPEFLWFACFSAAWYLEARPELPQSVAWWLYQARIDLPAMDFPTARTTPLRERRRLLKPFLAHFNVSLPLPVDDLIPSWAAEMIQPPRPLSELIEVMQVRPPLWLRAQTNDLDRLIAELGRDNIRVESHQRLPHALQATAAPAVNLRALEAFREGRIEVQDIASQAVGCICAPKPGEMWWDACAGAGGKTLHLAWLMQRKGSVLATDNRLYKLQDLKLRARRAQYPNITCKEWLGIDVPRYHRHFHGVLVDTPCSCSGTWRRNPDARWTTRPEELPEFTGLQHRLLTHASRAVAAGGTLVYSTCSCFAAENQDLVNRFLAENADFALQPFACPITGRQTDGMSQVWPWDADCDAMFTAKFVRIS